MSEEIKETLDDVKRHLDYVEATKQSSIRDNEMKIMYDYITNLQQKVEQLEKDKSYANWYAVKKEKEVEQLENIRKEAIDWINENKHLSMFADCREPEEDWNYDLECNANDLLNILNKRK